jgi:hypothetical protein
MDFRIESSRSGFSSKKEPIDKAGAGTRDSAREEAAALIAVPF